jgi:hypothetical protein
MTKPVYFKPYQKETIDLEYNRLFCDDLSLYRNQPEKFQGEDWRTLLTARPKLEAVRSVVVQHDLPARLRILAFNYLVKKGETTAGKELLGVILEAGVDEDWRHWPPIRIIKSLTSTAMA